jgi:hypothetical protein
LFRCRRAIRVPSFLPSSLTLLRFSYGRLHDGSESE